ncbi:MAG: malto-oligosyltrehalose trehalohydrolase [Verrucomicrobiota bacterium]|nr:malto-oligosyltrehalose trehalohydrolase [Verrucomicrobiota bacterium]
MLPIGSHLRSQGADLLESGVRYRTWCKHDRADVLVIDQQGAIGRVVQLAPEGDGYFSAIDGQGSAGDLYQYRFSESQGWPDPASRCQPLGVHGASMVVDPRSYQWNDEAWSRPAFSELIIYELHIGAFTAAGSFASAVERFDHLVRLGVNAIELMPLGDFPGDRNWGYDGVMLYAPARAYGSPDDLRAFVDAAHLAGLAVILDVVYNHLGPDGNYTGVYHGGYTNPKVHTPWGSALDYTVAPVRAFFVENAPYWMEEFHIDGFRLDATHEIFDPSPRHLLAEISDTIHSLGGWVIAEDERNAADLLRPTAVGGLGADACWSDDFHHIVRVTLTRDHEGYYANYEGTARELAETLTHGWWYRGQHQLSTGRPRGTDPRDARLEQFVYCISNHDQAGNRAFGERLGQLVSRAAYRAASALLCLAPETPLLFMGQEWNASSPFQFFTDHNPELGRQITVGRRREFSGFAAFRDPAVRETIPDPQAAGTFSNSKLRWDEIHEEKHAQVISLYREFLALRREHPAFGLRSRENFRAVALETGIVALLFGRAEHYDAAVLVDLVGGHPMPDLDLAELRPGSGRAWHVLVSSNDCRFGGDATAFTTPTTMVLQAR